MADRIGFSRLRDSFGGRLEELPPPGLMVSEGRLRRDLADSVVRREGSEG